MVNNRWETTYKGIYIEVDTTEVSFDELRRRWSSESSNRPYASMYASLYQKLKYIDNDNSSASDKRLASLVDLCDEHCRQHGKCLNAIRSVHVAWQAVVCLFMTMLPPSCSTTTRKDNPSWHCLYHIDKREQGQLDKNRERQKQPAKKKKSSLYWFRGLAGRHNHYRSSSTSR